MRSFLMILVSFLTLSASAQNVLKGTVYENGTNNRLSNVFVHDNNNKQLALTDKQGNFEIKTATGHILIFDSPGFISDTLYLIDLKPKKIMMDIKTISLKQVNITSSRQSFDPRKEYPEVYTKSKVYVLSPSTWFSKEGKDARRLKRYFQHEAEERHIDQVFSPAYVSSIVPLKGKDLEDFITMFRPTYAFLRDNNRESLAVYINDAYKKFLAVPPEKRSLPKLVE